MDMSCKNPDCPCQSSEIARERLHGRHREPQVTIGRSFTPDREAAKSALRIVLGIPEPTPFHDIRCPQCNKLACRAKSGSLVKVRCVRCKVDYRVSV